MNNDKPTIAERIRAATIADSAQEGVNIAEGRFGSAMASLCRELDELREDLEPKTVRELLEHEHVKALSSKQINDVLSRIHGENQALKQRLTIAEQRNAVLTTLLREGLEEYKSGDDWIDRVIAALRDQPTESGASEECPPYRKRYNKCDGGHCFIGGQCFHCGVPKP
jgi:predicted  nucleic acid-binding Zn-ribbon protein